jgi:hypothetical protein
VGPSLRRCNFSQGSAPGMLIISKVVKVIYENTVPKRYRYFNNRTILDILRKVCSEI